MGHTLKGEESRNGGTHKNSSQGIIKTGGGKRRVITSQIHKQTVEKISDKRSQGCVYLPGLSCWIGLKTVPWEKKNGFRPKGKKPESEKQPRREKNELVGTYKGTATPGWKHKVGKKKEKR